MEKLKPYSGVIALSIAICGIILSIIIYPEWLDLFGRQAFSDFGTYPQTQLIFNTSIIVSALIGMYFANYLFSKIPEISQISKLQIMLSYFSLAFVAVPYDLSLEIHWIGAIVYFVSTSFSILFFGLDLKNRTYMLLAALSIISLGGIIIDEIEIYVAQASHIAITAIWIILVTKKLIKSER